jgi:hypothetical protein
MKNDTKDRKISILGDNQNRVKEQKVVYFGSVVVDTFSTIWFQLKEDFFVCLARTKI